MKAGFLVKHPMFGVGIVMEVQPNGYPLVVRFYRPVVNHFGSRAVHVDKVNNLVWIDRQNVEVIK